MCPITQRLKHNQRGNQANTFYTLNESYDVFIYLKKLTDIYFIKQEIPKGGHRFIMMLKVIKIIVPGQAVKPKLCTTPLILYRIDKGNEEIKQMIDY